MKVTSTTIDNLTEILTQIIEFTERRRQVLTHNLFDYKNPGFRPCDMPVTEFAGCMTEAVTEHVCSQRILVCDRKHVRFEEDGCFDAVPVIDHKAEKLLLSDLKQYLHLQIHKLSENLMNNRIAVELLKQKQLRNSG
jgi:flagellar basal body rod protein FlgB